MQLNSPHGGSQGRRASTLNINRMYKYIYAKSQYILERWKDLAKTSAGFLFGHLNPQLYYYFYYVIGWFNYPG